MTLEYDLFIRREGKDPEFRKVERPEGATDEEYFDAALEARNNVKEELGALGLNHNVMIGKIDTPSEAELAAFVNYDGPTSSINELIRRV